MEAPSVEFMRTEQVLEHMQSGNVQSVVGVRQKIEGQFSGDSLLLLSETQAHSLVALLFKNKPNVNAYVFEREALVEVGNITLNAVLAGIGNMLGIGIKIGLPIHVSGNWHDIFAGTTSASEPNTMIMLVKMAFKLSAEDVEANVLVALGAEGQDNLFDSVSKFLEQLGRESKKK